MPEVPHSQVNAAIERALRDGAGTIERRGIMVVRSLDATTYLRTEEPVLEQALYAIFRGLLDRLMPGSTLLVSTRDRAGGDVELVWEAREMEGGSSEEARIEGSPYADLLELAIQGLESFCRVRTAGVDEGKPPGASSSNVLRRAPSVRRRYLMLIPTMRRDGW